MKGRQQVGKLKNKTPIFVSLSSTEMYIASRQQANPQKFFVVVLPSTSASCAVGEVGGVSGGSSLSLDCRGVAVAPIWSSRQNVPVLSPKYLSPELPSSSRARVPWQRRAWLNSPLGCIRLAKPSEK